jgi:hypothetical protein
MPTETKKVFDPIADSIAKAVVTIVEAVAVTAAAGAGAAQSTAGTQSTTGGSATEAGQSSQATVSSAQHKNDVSVPEAMESLNLHAVKDANLVNKALVGQAQSNAKLYDVTTSALGLAVLGCTHNMTLQQQMASDHRDQNHDKQINIDEQVAAALILYGRLGATMNNPIPPTE